MKPNSFSNSGLNASFKTDLNSTMSNFNKDIKIRTVDKDVRKEMKEMKRFKTLEEPKMETGFNAETLKRLSGCRDLAKVK